MTLIAKTMKNVNFGESGAKRDSGDILNFPLVLGSDCDVKPDSES